MQETYGQRRKLCPNNLTMGSSFFYWVYWNSDDLYLATAYLLMDKLSFLIYMQISLPKSLEWNVKENPDPQTICSVMREHVVDDKVWEYDLQKKKCLLK